MTGYDAGSRKPWVAAEAANRLPEPGGSGHEPLESGGSGHWGGGGGRLKMTYAKTKSK